MKNKNKQQHRVLRLARKRLTSYLRDQGYDLGVNKPNLSFRLTNILANELGFIKNENEKHVKFQIRISKVIELSGRDLTKRTPLWADKNRIKEIYRNCKARSKRTGILYHVDHVVPIKGKLVSGLHVPENLAIIEAKENLLKSNKF